MKKLQKLTLKKRIVGYCRISSEVQVKNGMSLDEQEKMIKDYWVNQNQGQIDEFFSDKGVSAFKSRTSRRLGWSRMIESLEKGDAIIASTMDRVFRSTGDFCLTIELLKQKGIDLYLADKGLITGENITNGLTLSILASVSQFESQLKAKRIQEVKSFQAANFIYSGGKRTRGFVSEKIGSRKFMVVNQLEKNLLEFVAVAKKKRDEEMKQTNFPRVKDESQWSLKNIRRQLVKKIINFGVKNKSAIGFTNNEIAERQAFSISTLHYLVSDDEKKNVNARLARLKESTRKIRMIDGEYVLSKDLAGTSRRQDSFDGGVGQKQLSLLSAGLRSRQKKDKAIQTRI